MEKTIIAKQLSHLHGKGVFGNNKELQFEIWKIDDLEALNKTYEIKINLPGYYGIGSDGAGELLTIELSTGKIFSIPFIPMISNERKLIADSVSRLNVV